jgi:hypothetical protein
VSMFVNDKVACNLRADGYKSLFLSDYNNCKP